MNKWADFWTAVLIGLTVALLWLGFYAWIQLQQKEDGPKYDKPATFQECVERGECTDPQELQKMKNLKIVAITVADGYLTMKFSDGTVQKVRVDVKEEAK